MVGPWSCGMVTRLVLADKSEFAFDRGVGD